MEASFWSQDDIWKQDKPVDEELKLIIMDDKIEAKVLSLFKEWKELEKISRRKIRCEKDFFKMPSRMQKISSGMTPALLAGRRTMHICRSR